jgi:hypothetical protein
VPTKFGFGSGRYYPGASRSSTLLHDLRAVRTAVSRADSIVAAIPLATTDPSAFTSQVQPELSGSGLTLYETELAID